MADPTEQARQAARRRRIQKAWQKIERLRTIEKKLAHAAHEIPAMRREVTAIREEMEALLKPEKEE